MKILPIPIILVLPLLKTLFDGVVIVMLIVGYFLFSKIFGELETTIDAFLYIIFTTTIFFPLFLVIDSIGNKVKKVLSIFYLISGTRKIEEDWNAIKAYIEDGIYWSEYIRRGRDGLSMIGYISLAIMFYCLKMNFDGHIKPPIASQYILLIGLPYVFFYLISIIYLFNYNVDQ